MGEREEEEKKAKNHVVLCMQCEKHVNAKVQGEYGFFDQYAFEPVDYILLECPDCSSPMLARRDYFDDGEGHYEALEPMLIYPERHRRLSHIVPDAIRSSYEEAVNGYGARTYTASALMCRRTLEALVSEKVGKKKINLASGLKDMQKSGLIDPTLLEWADMLRVSGNKAAHDVEAKVAKQDAHDLIEFTHALIEYVFTYKQRFEEFKKRSQKAEVRIRLRPPRRLVLPASESEPDPA